VEPNKHAAKGGLERALLTGLVEEGMTIAEIAAVVGRRKSTVRYWMRRFGLRSQNGRGPRTGNNTLPARTARLASAIFSCRHHGETEFVLEGRGYYRCKECRTERISRRRRRLKEIIVSEAGGRCSICGYHRYLGALQFHHVNPEEKRLGLAEGGLTLALDTVRAEARKCILLCSNCHAEVEAGITALPARVVTGREAAPMHHNLG
jgi:5-methylcytosine-specific restriction endonuclease McrA